jgi:hypothetical protein
MPTFYVRPTNGDDTNDGLSFVNAFKTTQKAILGVTTDTGDEQIFLCNEGIEDVTEQVNLLRDVARTNPVFIRTANSSGVTGATLGLNKYTIRATGGSYSGNGVLGMSGGNDGNAYSDDYRCYDIIFDANDVAAYGYYHALSAAANVNFWNCRFTNATTSGARHSAYNSHTFFGCEFDNNTSYGWQTHTANRGNSLHFNCSYHDNGTGLYAGNNVDLFNCRIYDNTNYGIEAVNRYNASFEMTSCVVYNNGSHGYYVNNNLDTSSGNVFTNTVIVNNGGYGIQSNTTEIGSGMKILGCIVKNNTPGQYNFTAVTYPPPDSLGLQFTDANVTIPDFDAATGKFNYSSEAVDAMFPFGGAPGAVSREGFSTTISGSLSLGTGDVGDVVTVSGTEFQKVSNSPIVWNVI